MLDSAFCWSGCLESHVWDRFRHKIRSQILVGPNQGKEEKNTTPRIRFYEEYVDLIDNKPCFIFLFLYVQHKPCIYSLKEFQYSRIK
jgi:hypothetical protein